MATLATIQQAAREYNPNFRPRPIDQGSLNTFANSAKYAFNQSFGSALMRNVQGMLAEHLDKKNGLEPLTEEEFNRTYSLNGLLKYREGITPTRARLEAEWKLEELWGGFELSGSRHRWLAQFAGGIAGSVAHPIDIATMIFTPGVGVAAKLGQVAKGAKTSVKAWNNVKNFGKYVMQGAKAGAIDGAWQAPAMLALNQNIQQNYSTADAAVDFFASPIFGGVLGGVGFLGRKAVAGVDLQEALLNQDGAKTALTALSQKEVAKHISTTKRINEIMHKPDEELTSRDMDELAELVARDIGPVQMPHSPKARLYGVQLKNKHQVESRFDKLVYKDIDARAKDPEAPDQVALDRLMANLFGVRLKFARMDAGKGAVFAERINTLYISDAVRGEDLVGVVGHEFSHSLRIREPELFREVADRIAALPESNKIFREAFSDISGLYGTKRWKQLSPARRMDEGVAQTMFRVFQEKSFWDSLNDAPDLKTKLIGFLQHLLNRVKQLLSSKELGAGGQVTAMQRLADDIGAIVAKANPRKQSIDDRWFVSKPEQQEAISDLVRNLRTRNASFILEHMEKLAEPKKKLTEAEREVEQSMENLWDFEDNWFGVPFNDWVKFGVLRESARIENPETIHHIREFETAEMGPLGRGIPRYFDKNGKVMNVRPTARDVKPARIIFYQQGNPLVRPPVTKVAKTPDALAEEQRAQLARDIESEFQQDQGLFDDQEVDLDSTYSPLAREHIRTHADLEDLLDKTAHPKRFPTLAMKADWFARRLEEMTETRVQNREDFRVESKKLINRMKTELRGMAGNEFKYRINGETYPRKLRELSDSEVIAAWLHFSNKWRNQANLPPLEIFPPEEFRSVGAAPLETAGQNIPADVNTPERVRTRDAIRKLLTGREEGVSNKRIQERLRKRQRELKERFKEEEEAIIVAAESKISNIESDIGDAAVRLERARGVESPETIAELEADLAERKTRGKRQIDEITERLIEDQEALIDQEQDALLALTKELPTASDLEQRVNIIEGLIHNMKRIRGLEPIENQSQILDEQMEYDAVRKTKFFGLGEDLYWEALEALDERFQEPGGFFDVMELPSPREFTNEKFNKYRSNIQNFMDRLDQMRNDNRIGETLMQEKSMAQKAQSDTDGLVVIANRDKLRRGISSEFFELSELTGASGEEAAVRRKELRAIMPEDELILMANYNNTMVVYGRVEKAFLEGKIQTEDDLVDVAGIPFRLREKLRPMLREDMTTWDQFRDLIEDEMIRTQFNLLNDFTIHRDMVQEARSSRNPLKWISTRLDGQYRRETDIDMVRGSVEHHMKARVEEELSSLVNVLDAENMFDAFMNDTITTDIVRYLESDRQIELPKEIKRVADHIYNLYRKQVNEMTAAGGDVKWLKGFALSQVWDTAKVRAATFDEFKDAILPHLDFERIKLFHEGNPRDPVKYLRAVYDDMASGQYRELHTMDSETFGGNIANQVSHHRSLFLKEGGTFPVMSKFGRGDSVSQMILHQLRKNAERTVMMENFGSNYRDTFNRFLENARVKDPPPQAKTLGRLKHAADFTLMEATFNMLSGDLDNPLDSNIANIGQNVRRYSNLVFLWQSGIAALNDMPSIVANLKYNGVDIRFRDKRFWQAYKNALNARDNKQAMIWARSNGAALNSVLNNMSARVALGETSPKTGLLGKWNNVLFNLNGLNLITDLGQSVFLDLMTLHLGSGEISGDLLRNLARYGINKADLEGARAQFARKTPGYQGIRLSPDMMDTGNPDLAARFRAFLSDNMRQSVIEPGVREQALARFGTRAGTVHGELIRIGAQYTTFPLAIQMKTWGRLFNAYGPRKIEGLMASGNDRAVVNGLSFAAAGIVMGYIASGIKDILKGREPIHFGNINPKNLTRVVDQSGVAGMIGPIFDGPVSPIAETIGETLADMSDGDISAYKLISTTQNTLPGATIPLIGPGQDSMKALFSLMIGDGLGIQYETHFQNRLRFIEGELEQTSIFLEDND